MFFVRSQEDIYGCAKYLCQLKQVFRTWRRLPSFPLCYFTPTSSATFSCDMPQLFRCSLILSPNDILITSAYIVMKNTLSFYQLYGNYWLQPGFYPILATKYSITLWPNQVSYQLSLRSTPEKPCSLVYICMGTLYPKLCARFST